MPVYTEGTGVKPAEIARKGLAEAKRKNIDVVIVDTAGRLQVVPPLLLGMGSIRTYRFMYSLTLF